MKYRKGFALIEVIAVIVIISVLAIVGTITITNLISNSKEKAYKEQIKNITSAAKTWAIRNASLLAADHNYSVYITIDNLKTEGLLENKKITDPRTEEELKGCIQVIYNNENKKYDYNYSDNCSSSSEYPIIKVTGNNYIEVSQSGTPYDYQTNISVEATNSEGVAFTIDNPNYNIVGPKITKNGEVVSEIIPNKVGDEYLLTYEAIDGIKNLVSYGTIKLRVVDTTKPILNINGLNEDKNGKIDYSEIIINNNYDYPVLEATDNSGESIKVKRSGNVISTKEGEYKVVYTATDSSKNKAIYTLNVIVKLPGELKFNLTASTPDGDNGWYKSAAKITISDIRYNAKNLVLGTDVKCTYQINSGSINDLTTNTFNVSENGKNVIVKVICFATIDKEEYVTEKRLSLKIDTKVPTCGVTSNYSDWTNQDVILTGKCKDTGESGCVQETITKKIVAVANAIRVSNESPGIVKDEAGNITICGTVRVKMDNQVPTCTVTSKKVDNTAYDGSWINQNVILSAICNDGSGSGCDGVNPSYTVSVANGSVFNSAKVGPGTSGGTATVKDKAGNVTTCAANQTVKIDKQSPTCTVSGGSTSWTNKDVTVTGICSDGSGSGCTSVNPTYTVSVANDSVFSSTQIGPGINGQTVIVKDAVGNTAVCIANQTVKIDKKAPTCTVSGGSTSWTNQDVTINGVCDDDNGSGCQGTNPSYTVNVKNGSVFDSTTVGPGTSGRSVTIKDNAGNTATCEANQIVKIDKQSPKCTVSGGSTSWTNKNVTITGTCDDNSGSGCVGTNPSYTTNVTAGSTLNKKLGPGENGGTAIVKDAVGNEGACSVNQTVKIDKQPPTCETKATYEKKVILINIPVNYDGSWIDKDVTIKGTCDDDESGCDGSNPSYTTNVTDGSTLNKNLGPGVGGAVTTIKDKAGNVTSCGTVSVKIDRQAPTCIVTAKDENGNAYNGAWTNKDVSIKGTCNDSGSGCSGDGVVSITKTTNINSNDVYPGEVSDKLGNSTKCSSVTVKIDKDKPTIARDFTYNGRALYPLKSEEFTHVVNNSTGLMTSFIWFVNCKNMYTNCNFKSLFEISDTGGSGIKETQYMFKTNGSGGTNITSFGNAPSLFKLGSNWTNAEKKIRVIDYAGNISDVRTISYTHLGYTICSVKNNIVTYSGFISLDGTTSNDLEVRTRDISQIECN